MDRRIGFGSLIALLGMLSGACEEPSGFPIRGTGALRGLVTLDRNANGVIEPAIDGPVANVTVRLVPRGGGSAAATAVSNAVGNFSLPDIPAGDYELRVDAASIPDSLRLFQVDSSFVRVNAGDSLAVAVVLTYPRISVKEARTFVAGRRVLIEGVTHNALATFGDSSLHVADSTGVIRATRVISGAIPAGTRVRLLGTTGTHNGQPTLSDVTVFNLGTGTQPAPTAVTTAVAVSADNGKLDAALALINGAVIVGAQTNSAQDVILTVNDGSGLLDVVIDRQAGITGTFLPGATLSATGLLVPTATPGVWVLKPRTSSDLTAVFATVTVAEARQLPTGRAITIEGVALNSWFVFADSTVHLNDATGSIRAVRVAPVNLFAGDRVRLLGTIALREGQPVLTNVSASVLGAGVLPLPQVLSTAAAATANSGQADAALVKVSAATISSVVNVGGDLVLTVNDGTGPLDVVLDKDIGFALAPFVSGAVIDATGVMVTTPGGVVWRLKPRQPTDVVVR